MRSEATARAWQDAPTGIGHAYPTKTDVLPALSIRFEP